MFTIWCIRSTRSEINNNTWGLIVLPLVVCGVIDVSIMLIFVSVATMFVSAMG